MTVDPPRGQAPISVGAPSSGNPAGARRIGLRPFPEKLAGRSVSGSILRSVDRAIVELYGQRERDEIVRHLPPRYASDFMQGSINTIIKYDLEELDAYMEIATELVVREVEKWRQAGGHAVSGELLKVVGSLLRPAPDYAFLIKRAAIVLPPLLFGAWKSGASGGRTLLQLTEFEAAPSSLRHWIAGVLEETAKRAVDPGAKVSIIAGEMGFSPTLTFEFA